MIRRVGMVKCFDEKQVRTLLNHTVLSLNGGTCNSLVAAMNSVQVPGNDQ